MSESLNKRTSNLPRGSREMSFDAIINNGSFSKLQKVEPSYLEKLEGQLKELWSQYIHCLDKYGLNEKTKSLKQQYLNLYQNYKNYRDWKNAVGE